MNFVPGIKGNINETEAFGKSFIRSRNFSFGEEVRTNWNNNIWNIFPAFEKVVF